MGSGKQGSSEASSEENDRQEHAKEDAATTTKRFYECNFCRRGFTNAQALGGHMNIHRKDRTKTKQFSASSSISGKTNADYMNPNHMGHISSEPINNHPVLEAHREHSVYFRPSGLSNPRQSHGYYHGSDFLVSRHQSWSVNEEPWGANLSLQIGCSHLQDNEVTNKEVSKEDEVDLELRLGHDR